MTFHPLNLPRTFPSSNLSNLRCSFDQANKSRCQNPFRCRSEQHCRDTYLRVSDSRLPVRIRSTWESVSLLFQMRLPTTASDAASSSFSDSRLNRHFLR